MKVFLTESDRYTKIFCVEKTSNYFQRKNEETRDENHISFVTSQLLLF